ncbi:MAG TPA: ABC-2 family transporter protein [Pirellulaceae bacterium]|jgi:ABC-2 type transport system permease protein|nr:ABC-2 family transporter protein [Pirellulaceae bacterium]
MRPAYLAIWLTFARNSLVRDLTFRANFLIQCVSSLSWTLMNVGFYLIVFSVTDRIGVDTGWGRWEFFVFLATTMLVNSAVETFFMPNAEEFSELIRTGGLDFALLKPVDTQFLISLRKMDWSSLTNGAVGLVLLGVSLYQLSCPKPPAPSVVAAAVEAEELNSEAKAELVQADLSPTTTEREEPLYVGPVQVVLYVAFLACGVAIMYSLTIALAATSIWLGRNQNLYDFWFYITNFSRYPMEIYWRGWGVPLSATLTFLIPVLLVVNVPARVLARPLHPQAWWEIPLMLFALLAAPACLFVSRQIFRAALRSYRSASS